jgi:hypothetical protein
MPYASIRLTFKEQGFETKEENLQHYNDPAVLPRFHLRGFISFGFF